MGLDRISKSGLTRRQFLKTTAVTAAVVAAGDKLFGGPVTSLVKSAEAAPVKEDKWIPIRPGTDRAMMMAMINVFLNALDVVDVECVKKGTNGPMKIGD